MEENETQEVETESGASEQASPEPASTESESAAPKEAAEPKQESTPFHEHPRFKELVEQKNAAQAQQKELAEKYARLEQQFQSMPKPQAAPTKEQSELAALVADLEKVDPRLAAQIKAASAAAQSQSQMQEKLEALEKGWKEEKQQAQVQAAVAKVNALHAQNKVGPELKQIINNQIDLLYMQGKLNMQNIDSEYKKAHDAYGKFIEDIKRSTTQSYVADKKKDASVPTSQPKGTPAKPAQSKPKWDKDPEKARQQIVSRFLKQQSANKEADSV